MNEAIVASAITTFNNAALWGPAFLWSAVLMLPVYLAAAMVAGDLLSYFFPLKKARDFCFAWWFEGAAIVWLVFGHGNWEVLRDGAGFLPYIVAGALFLLCRDAAARLREWNPRAPKSWRRFDSKTRKWLKLAILLVAVAIIGASASPRYYYQALQIAATLFGTAAGFWSRRPYGPIPGTMFMMALLTTAVAMQPEYFRFGQLGRLSLAHLGALAAIIGLAALCFVLRNFNPSGFVRDNHYKYIKWFMRLCVLLAFILFVMTESVPVLLGLGAAVAMTAWFAVKHAAKGTIVAPLSENVWAAMLILFGVITGMPLVAIIGILCWKNNAARNWAKNLIAIMK
ncbi:MAG: hypothetical protein LBL46_02235 [Rickettsiales bacterium]|jgi:hypothetical protein|nr:hypothetical protein [Rickettsiales bacterium]